MKKKTAKKSKATDKKAAKKSTQVSENHELNPAKVLHDISARVEEQAQLIVDAVIAEGKKGQLSPAKFLFEMAHIFPQASGEDANQTSERENSLAETLLDRLKIPKTPVVHDELQKEEDEDEKVSQPKKENSDEKDETEEDKTETVTVH